uniref:Uncharacterized protein n=1 Tax=Cacopsylla melanoneura TaxID=428564 RepID=A0A8D9ETG2_9HEMI
MKEENIDWQEEDQEREREQDQGQGQRVLVLLHLPHPDLPQQAPIVHLRVATAAVPLPHPLPQAIPPPPHHHPPHYPHHPFPPPLHFRSHSLQFLRPHPSRPLHLLPPSLPAPFPHEPLRPGLHSAPLPCLLFDSRWSYRRWSQLHILLHLFWILPS